MSGPRLALLDGFELRDNGNAIPVSLSAQRVLAFVALHEQSVMRRYVASKLWLDSNEEHATSSLRSSLWRLRRSGYELIEVAGPRLRLSPDLAVDVREATAWSRTVLDGDAEGAEIDVDGPEVHVHLGELLPDWYDDWVLFERERLRELRAYALESLCERLIASGSFAAAMRTVQAVVKLDPLRESAHRQLIRIHLADGNQSEAVRAYRLYSRLLRDELGLSPSSKMEQVMLPLAADRPRRHATLERQR
jgi:DNA-binding SARP family transcriptional activator